MPLSAKVRDFNRLLSDKFPELFGPDVDHHCQYREHLFQLIAADLQQDSTQKLAGLFSNLVHLVLIIELFSISTSFLRKVQSTRLPFTIAINSGCQHRCWRLRA
jgi:hypothetical protein